jgi:hypothetical protein
MAKIEFIKHTPESHPVKRGAVSSKEPMLSINGSNMITFNSALCAKLGIKAGDKVVFLQHPTEKDTWKVAPSTVEGFDVRKDTEKTLKVSNASLAKSIKDSMECPHGWTLRLLLVESGVFVKSAVIQPKQKD